MATTATITVNVENLPEMVWKVRKLCADALRAEAEAEADPRLQRRLRELAADFEVG